MNPGNAPMTDRRRKDTDSDIRPEIMRSMELPWIRRPVYSKAQTTTPKGVRKERRSRMVQRFFWHVKDDVNLAILILAILGVGVLFWMAIIELEKWLR